MENKKSDFKGEGIHRISTTIQDDVSKVVDSIEGKEQLKSTNNDVDVRAIAEAPQKDSMTAFNEDDGETAYGASCKGEIDEQNKNYPETERFSFMHQIDSEEMRKNNGMGKVAKTDDTAKGSQ